MEIISTVLTLSGLVAYFFIFSIEFSPLKVLIALFLSAVGHFFIDRIIDRRNYPPGPIGLPVVGSLISIIRHGTDDYLLKIFEKYGDIVTLRMGSIKNVIINDYEMIKEFSQHPKFQGRPQTGIFRDMLEGNGIADTEGTLWKHQRRFMIQALKDSSMNAMHVEETIVDELQKICKEIENQLDEPTTMGTLLEKMTCSVMFALAFRKHYDYDDPKFNTMIARLRQNLHIAEDLLFVGLFPWMRPFVSKGIAALKANTRLFENFADKFIEEHKQDLEEGSPDKDLVDMYLKELFKGVQTGSEISEYLKTFSEHQLKKIIVDLFIAGTETSSSTTKWAIYLMIQNPEIQERVHNEIVDVIGTERMPSYSDKLKLPYTMATLQEIERLATVGVRGIPRSNPERAMFRQYTFPARSFFSLNFHAVHMDPKLWDQPKLFNPSRFIDSDGKVFRPPYLVPFGSGKRMCAGESLARMEIFFLFVVLMQRYSFHSLSKTSSPIEHSSGIVRAPKPIEFTIKARL